MLGENAVRVEMDAQVLLGGKQDQDQIAKCLSIFDGLCKNERDKLQLLLQIRTSLLQHLFI